MQLCQRDGECPVTGEDDIDCLVACHIVPFSLGQSKVDEICGRLVMGTFSVANGLLLTKSLHLTFDRFLWGIYTFQGSYYVHIFGGIGHGGKELHGKQLQFRCRKKQRLPNIKLLEWHYAQCLMARFRGRVVKQ